MLLENRGAGDRAKHGAFELREFHPNADTSDAGYLQLQDTASET